MNMEGKLGTQRVVPSAMLFKMAAILNQLSLGWTMIIFIYLTYNVSYLYCVMFSSFFGVVGLGNGAWQCKSFSHFFQQKIFMYLRY